jgi:hypothetical protein
MKSFRPFLVLLFFLIGITQSFAQQVVITNVTGTVEIWSENEWKPVDSTAILTGREKIRTGENSICTLIFMQGHELRISPKTELELEKLTANETYIKLLTGKGTAKVKKLSKLEGFNIKTPTTLAAVRGTDFSVEFINNVTRIEVYEGLVAAQEESTGQEVLINTGEFSIIEHSQPPSNPEPLPEKEESTILPEETNINQLRLEAQREIFNEISREQVMARAADEIKLAEYQNGKAMIDAYGMRVRIEEYIVRQPPLQFKYVVLNEREKRFDFGKILFTFNHESNLSLPPNLNSVTKNMFKNPGDTAPEWKLDGLDSIISNTADKILEIASNGDYMYDSEENCMEHYFKNYEFWVGDSNSGEDRLRYERNFVNGLFNYTFYKYPAGVQAVDSNVQSTSEEPEGTNYYHKRDRDAYSDDFILQLDSYLIDDDGKYDKETLGQTDLDRLNFEFVYSSEDFSDEYENKIDLVGSVKLLNAASLFVE